MSNPNQETVTITPHDLPLHLVVQAGVNPAIREDWHDDLEWEQTILFRPLRAPGLVCEPLDTCP